MDLLEVRRFFDRRPFAVSSISSLLRVEETWEAVGFLWLYPPFPVSCPFKATVAPRKSPPSQTPPCRITATELRGAIDVTRRIEDHVANRILPIAAAEAMKDFSVHAPPDFDNSNTVS
jgi:hypothetical protein